MKTANQLLYPALFLEDVNNFYFVEFPDLEGCLTQGNSLTEAYFNAQKALAIYAKEYPRTLPEPSKLSIIEKENPNKIVLLIGIETDKYVVKSLDLVKKTLTIPKWLNDISLKYDINFSKILKNALINYLLNDTQVSDEDKRMLRE